MLTNAKILVVDDEKPIVQTIQAYLEREGFTVHTAFDGPTALQAVRAYRPDLIILDIMLPGLDGLEVLRQIRTFSDVYVIMLTARTEEPDRIVGLTMGADDYVTKPFSPRELVARVKAVLRRQRGANTSDIPLRFRRLQIDHAARKVWKDGKEVNLTPLEFDVLHTLARHHGRALSRDQLIESVWGYDYFGDDRVVDVHIGHLRKKIEDDPAHPTLIVTVRGVGYRFEDEPV
nr:response regulator transcription factor [Ardenticatena sp.]